MTVFDPEQAPGRGWDGSASPTGDRLCVIEGTLMDKPDADGVRPASIEVQWGAVINSSPRILYGALAAAVYDPPSGFSRDLPDRPGPYYARFRANGPGVVTYELPGGGAIRALREGRLREFGVRLEDPVQHPEPGISALLRVVRGEPASALPETQRVIR